MKKTMFKKFASLFAVAGLAVGLAACNNGEDVPTGSDESSSGSQQTQTGNYDNESTPFVMATQSLDGVFNPFFSTSAYDGEIAGATQISMLSTDSNGSVKVGEDEPCVVLDYNVETTDTRTDKTDKEDYDNYYTTYEFVIKNGLKFSNGSDLTIQDVLFNMYVLLDPCYTGSTTMYSVNIKGLKAYRAQSYNTGEQNNAEQYFDQIAAERLQAIRDWTDDMVEEDKVEQVLADIELMKPLFKDELKSDWNNAQASTDSYKETYKFTEGWQVFLWNYGLITLKKQSDDVWNEDTMGSECPEAIDWNGWDTKGPKMIADDPTGGKFIDAIYDNMVENEVEKTRKENIYKIVTYYATASTLKAKLVAQAKSDFYDECKQNGQLVVPNIEGITTYETTDFKDNKYSESHSVLKIVVNGVDPKAIWNFGFTVTPMYYYSTEEEVAQANISENHFGVTFGSADFMEQLQTKLVPVGAGPYRVTTKTGNPNGVSKVADFYNDNIVYFERNEHFYQPVNIKYIRYKVISANKLYDSVLSGEVDYADPSAQVQTINDIRENYSNRVGYKLVDNLGYGYIGINSSKIQDIEVRRALMYAMDTSLVLQYYTNEMASVIYRPMSSISWAYPEGCSEYYPYVGRTYEDEADQIAFIESLVEEAGYTKNAKGIYHKWNEYLKSDQQLDITFTLAGESTNHPAYNTFDRAARLLNKCGFKITVAPDPNALSKLSIGGLAVWAAAWGSTIDPDMYQVYHKDSTATSVNNWGYPYLKENGTTDEIEIMNELSKLIDEGRETTVQSERKAIYADALDKVMDLAVELPTYQRKNLFVYNKAKLDESTMNQDITPYNGPISEIWKLSYNK